MRKRSDLVFLLSIVLWLIPVFAFSAEKSFVVPRSIPDTSRYLMDHRRDVETLNRTFQTEEQEARQRIAHAARKVYSTTDITGRNYYRMEYIRQRALHCNVYATHLITLKRNHESFLRNIAMVDRYYLEMNRSDQVQGLRDLFLIVLDLQKPSARNRILRPEMPDSQINEFYKYTAKEMELWILAGILTPPKVIDPVYRRKIEAMGDNIKDGLRAILEELDYLSDRLDGIPTGNTPGSV